MSKRFFISLFKADEVDSETFNGVPEVPKPGERGRPHHITVARVQLRHPRNKLSSRPVSMPVERILSRGRVDENNTRNSADQEVRGFDESIEEVDETENAKLRVATHYRSKFIDTQTLRRTWDKQYKQDAASRTVRIVASSSTESTSEDISNLSASVPSTLSLGTSGSTLFPNRPYTIAVRPSRTLRREDNVTKYSPIATAFRAPRTLQPPPGTFYKPPSGNKAIPLPNCASANSAEEEDEDEEDEEEEEDEDDEELGIEIEVSVDEPLEEDIEAEQGAMSQSPSSSPEELGQNQGKPVYQRLRPRRLQEVEHREAHFVWETGLDVNSVCHILLEKE